LKANFIYSNLNPCGGGERFTLVTMNAVVEMGIEVDLTTLENPNLSKLENAFGKDLTSIMKQIRKLNVLQMFDQESIDNNITDNDYDLIINTHGDIDPYYSPKLSKAIVVTYCHYPSAKSFIENKDSNYFEYHLKVNRMHSSSLKSNAGSIINADQSLSYLSSVNKRTDPDSIIDALEKENCYIKWVKETYDKMIRNSFLITNSQYSRKAIIEAYGIDEAIVLSPPVAVNNIRDSLGFSSPSKVSSEHRNNLVLVICRIEPSKRIENAIYLAKVLKEKKIETKMIIVGSWEPFYQKYYESLERLLIDKDVSDIITFKINASFEELLELMKKSKVYFHPREGEHFGISVVEAMSAGLVPVVPSIGGQAEFVPTMYQYNSLEQASQIVSSVLDVGDEERQRISDSVIQFSDSNYKRQFQLITNKLIYNVNIDQQYNFPHFTPINK
jgi:glycosyltransferase involved in cell wall biosynthesis